MSRLRRALPLVLAGLGGAVLGVLAGSLGWAAWTFSGALVRPSWQPDSRLRARVRGDGGAGDEVTLRRTYLTRTPGQLGLSWDGGWAVLSETVRSGEDSDTRRILRSSSPLPDGSLVQPIPNVYDGTPEQVGLGFDEVNLPTPHGEVPAWVVPSGAAPSDWMVFVHGHGGHRAQSIRLLPAVHSLGLNALVVSYRNTHEGPATRDRYVRLGATEWEDVEAALRYAQAQGARRVILFGYSMGGNIVLSLLRRSKLAAELVRGAVLDSPALDWRDLLHYQATRLKLPTASASLIEGTASLRLRQPFHLTNQLRGVDELQVPILIFHGDFDETVPLHQSEALAAARPDLVRLLTVPGAAHIRAWNLDPKGYEAELREWVKQLLNDPQPPQGGNQHA